MGRFAYRVSVIVPVYNSEEYLEECLDSLLRQTLAQQDMEVLLIDDGSEDGSLRICRQYADMYENFKAFTKENEGLSATRNFGIKRASGRYIAYLDSDDKYAPDTLKNVCDFFDSHYGEIDLVTFPIVRYQKGKALKLHYRYDYLTETGIYDLSDTPFAAQTNINVTVKNMLGDNILFDVTPGFRHEDMAYNNRVVARKMKVGYVKEAEYRYNRDNESSIVANYMYPYYIFETTMEYYETLFAQYEKVPSYYQALFVSDLEWKLCDDKLFPFHYGEEEMGKAIGRIRKLLGKCNTDIIVNHPIIDNFHIQYWLRLKPDVFPAVLAYEDRTDIVAEGETIYSRNYFEIIMHKIRVKNGICRMLGFVKSPVYSYVDEPARVWVVENGVKRYRLDVFESIHSYYKNQFTKTNFFYAFDYSCDARKVKEFRFEVELDGFFYPTRYWCMPVAVFDGKKGMDCYIRENTLLTLRGDKILLRQVEEEEIEWMEHEANQRYRKDTNIFRLREQALKYRKEHKIWLYYDAYTVKKDNGYYQFIHDRKYSRTDGVERYYVITNEESRSLFSDEEKQYLVKFGSETHKLLYLCSQCILTAYFGFSTISPFSSEKEEADYADLIKFETIYLQHGVLHAALHTYNAAERCRAEKIVVSSPFEIENYQVHYHYKETDLIPTGMARYDFIDRKKKSGNKILYAPSWRKYLTFSEKASNWTVVAEKLAGSEYFTKITEFVNDRQLEELLADNDLTLEVKLHPIIAKEAGKLLDIRSGRVKMAEGEICVEDYKMFITDFSSYVFDFACLNRPVLYYVTDYMQFRSGMNHYKELDLPFEKAFGAMVTESRDAVEEVRKIIGRSFVPEEVYAERMGKFFLPLENCRERLYEFLTEGTQR